MTDLNADLSDTDFNLGPSRNQTYRNTDFSSTGLHRISAKAVVTFINELEAESPAKEILVHVWSRPVVLDRPINKGEVSWDENSAKYVGVKGETVRLKADGQTSNSDASEMIEEFIWDLGSEGTRTQLASDILELTPSTSNLNGTISVVAVTNYGIEMIHRRST